jgi:4-hydroxythreonine-4-phosphate dehydrogenase
MKRRPVVGITPGDPAGIGPEVMRRAIDLLDPGEMEIQVIGSLDAWNPGQPGAESARQARESLEEAARLALAGQIDAVVTGPVAKHELRKIGFPYPGQTEFFAARAGVADFAMILTGGKLTVGLVTVHEPLARVPELLTGELIRSRARLLLKFLQQRGLSSPRIAVAGLNPHAGEQGEIGREEIEIIAPAVSLLQVDFPGVFCGPLAPDTVFHRAVEGEFDAVLCQYHDQGLIPLKLHAFHGGVNVTAGLPFVRTSPDHGTAFSLAGKGVARADSALAALRLAAELATATPADKTGPGL